MVKVIKFVIFIFAIGWLLLAVLLSFEKTVEPVGFPYIFIGFWASVMCANIWIVAYLMIYVLERVHNRSGGRSYIE